MSSRSRGISSPEPSMDTGRALLETPAPLTSRVRLLARRTLRKVSSFDDIATPLDPQGSLAEVADRMSQPLGYNVRNPTSPMERQWCLSQGLKGKPNEPPGGFFS